jgi:hypothetical protein
VDKLAQSYTERLNDALFRLIERNDYDDQSPRSVGCYIQTLEACLRGGITEARPTPHADGSIPPLTGPSAKAWKAWLKDGQSLVYQTLLARNQSLLQALAPSFNQQGELDWNDSEKIYSAVTKVIGSSDLGEHLLLPPIQEAIASVQSAYNDAAGRLGQAVDLGVEHVTTRLNSATLLLYARIHTTQLSVQMQIGEYYKLMCEGVWDKLQQSAAAVDKAPTKVRSVLAGGVLSLSLSDPKLAEKIIPVVLWVQGSAEALSQRFGSSGLAQAQRQTRLTAQQLMAQLGKLKVLAGTLQPGAHKLLSGLQLHSAQAASLVRSGLSMGRNMTHIGLGTVGKADLLFAVAGTYLLAAGMRKSIKTAEDTLGAKHDEAITALYGAYVTVVGGSIEVLGKTMEGGAQQAQKVLRLQGASASSVTQIAKAGERLARYGAVIGSVGGYFDAMVACKAGIRAGKAGDTDASDIYLASAALSGLSATILSVAAFAESTAILSASSIIGVPLILGPVGWGIFLGLTAYILYKLAEGQESSPLEHWAKFCYFGESEEELKWADANTAVAALNVAVLGIDVSLNFESGVRIDANKKEITYLTSLEEIQLQRTPTYFSQITYQIIIPNYNALHSGYSWQLVVKRYSGTEALSSGRHPHQADAPPAKALTSVPPNSKSKRKYQDYDPETVLPRIQERSIATVDGSQSNFLVIQGSINLRQGHDIDSAEIHLEYLPNIHDKEMLAKIGIKEYSS